jgi:hypothetical protein
MSISDLITLAIALKVERAKAAYICAWSPSHAADERRDWCDAVIEVQDEHVVMSFDGIPFHRYCLGCALAIFGPNGLAEPLP